MVYLLPFWVAGLKLILAMSDSSHSAFIWSVADLLHGYYNYYKQSEV
jgi:hypothetical protein